MSKTISFHIGAGEEALQAQRLVLCIGRAADLQQAPVQHALRAWLPEAPDASFGKSEKIHTPLLFDVKSKPPASQQHSMNASNRFKTVSRAKRRQRESRFPYCSQVVQHKIASL